MDLLLKDIYLAGSVHLQEALVTKLNAQGFFYLDDFEEIYTWELFKVRGIGLNKFALIQTVMKKHNIKFKDGYLKLPKKIDDYLFKQGMICK